MPLNQNIKKWEDVIPVYFYTGLEDQKLIEDESNLISLVEKFKQKYENRIGVLEPTQMVVFFQDEEQISVLMGKIGIYFLLITSIDTQNQNYLKASNQFQTKATQIANQMLFVDQEFKQIPDSKYNQLISAPELENWRYYLEKKASGNKHLLSKEVEEIINLKDLAGANVLQNIYDELTGSFEYQIELDGKVVKMTEEEVRALRESVNRETRQKAVEAISQKYSQKENQIILGNVYAGVVKNWVYEAKKRGYSSPIGMQNFSEELEDKTVQTMLEAVEKRQSLYQRYLIAKKRLLKVDELMVWDILAPLGLGKAKQNYEYQNLKTIILELAKNFDQEFWNYFNQILEDGRVDPFPAKGKRGGGYCVSYKNQPSLILLNLTNELSDGIALAHELGHAIHGYFSQNQSLQNYDTPLCLAETASVFNQTLFLEGLILEIEKDKDTQAEMFLLDKTIGEICNYVFKSSLTTSFELEVHNRLDQGLEMNYTELNLLWREKSQKLNGGVVKNPIQAEKEAGWSAIPHIFHTPFYNYSYCFGNLLSLALYSLYKKEGKGFVEKYKSLLKAGGSKKPAKILQDVFGLDINNSGFYNIGLDYLEKLVQKFEKLV